MSRSLTKLIKLRKWALTSKEFDLRFWAVKNECGTTLCLAGKTVVEAGYRMIWPGKVRGAIHQAQHCLHPETDIPLEIPVAAREVLGLTEEEGSQLFTPSLEQSAAEASGNNQVDTTDLEQQMALDFLETLIERGRHGARNMDDEEVYEWARQWAGAHYDELAETGMDD